MKSQTKRSKIGDSMLAEIGLRVVKSWQLEQLNQVSPRELEKVFQFDEDFKREYNTLFCDPSKRLFLADTKGEDCQIMRGEELILLENSTPADFKKVSLRDALLWYARCNPFSNGSTGSVELLCEMAAERLKD